MKFKITTGIILTAFVFFCGVLVLDSGLFEACPERSRGEGVGNQIKPVVLLASEATLEEGDLPGATGIEAGDTQSWGLHTEGRFTSLQAVGGRPKTVTLGSVDPASGFKFQVELSSKGAAVRTATLSEYNDRHPGEGRFVLLSPVSRRDGSETLSMANGDFVFADEGLKLRLDRLDWMCSEVMTEDYSEIVSFEAVIRDAEGKDAVKLTKNYTVMRDSYHLECEMEVENLTGDELKMQFELQGPLGIKREGTRIDARKIVGGFAGADGRTSGMTKEIATPFTGKLRNRLGLRDATKEYEAAQMAYRGAQTEPQRAQAQQRELTALQQLRIRHDRSDVRFLWAATVNKYFTAILRPVPEAGNLAVDWVTDKVARYYDRDETKQGDETVGFSYTIGGGRLEAGGIERYKFQLYLGPKDKNLFEKNELYRKLGFFHTITFLSCCCPASMVNPLAFGILAVMKWMYGIIPNYGIVIIIFVFLVRLVLHPVTKRSQVSMMKMQKLGPQVEEIKKQYEHNKAEMNKRVMGLYKEQGATPIMGCLPMLLQMPIWIALYSAIYASIDLRGAPFLPVWITDLSAPDALVKFSAVNLPLLGKLESFNLLPILLGVGMYLQQKLMPHPSSVQSSANPQAAQQQKMMQIMMPIMMLLFLYNAPSGLNLYIMASTFAGILEQYVIRRHREELEEKGAEGLVEVTAKTGGKAKKKKPKSWIKY